jgi:hypothetical protein
MELLRKTAGNYVWFREVLRDEVSELKGKTIFHRQTQFKGS